MKRNAIARIIVFSIVILVLLGILLAGVSIDTLRSVRWETGRDDTPGGDSPSVTGNSGTVSAGIRDIKIEWVSGTITILPGDVDSITYQESAVSDEDHKLVAKESEGELEISFCRDKIGFPSFGISIDYSKDLTITVPRDIALGSLEIETASAAVIVQDMTIREVEFDGASGTCTFSNCTVTDLEIDTASGNVRFTGALTRLDFDGASADLQCDLANTPASIQVDTMSGDLDITLPADSGFTVKLDALSGDFTSDFPTTTQNGSHVYGDGACRINVSAMSGDVTIRKGQ